MRSLFPGFYPRTKEEIAKLWQEGIFVFDTNMLLNIYRYTEKTRERYFEILHRLKAQQQLWIPYQVAYEYQDRRFDVIQGQLEAYTEVSNILQTTYQKLENSLEPYKKKHGFIDTSKMINEIGEAIKNAKSDITESKENDKKVYETFKKDDKLQMKLEMLFQDNVGKPYDKNKLEEVYKQAQMRIELKIPPGWEDIGKKSFKTFGDIILWFQLLEYARLEKKSIVFVTDDGKKDWWLSEVKSRGQKRPLPELVQEMYIEAGVLLHMYEGYEFLKEAQLFLKLDKQPEVIEEAQKVTQQNTLEVIQRLGRVNRADRWEDRLQFAVLKKLESIFPDAEYLPPYDESSNVFFKRADGQLIGVEINIGFQPFSESVISAIIASSSKNYSKVNADFKILVLAFLNQEDAELQLKDNFKNIDIPDNIMFAVGYLEKDEQFTLIDAFP